MQKTFVNQIWQHKITFLRILYHSPELEEIFWIDINDEKNSPRSVYSLVQKQELPAAIESENLDLWRFAHKYRDWMNWVDAAYGSAVFLPMTDSAKYTVAISRTGLIARPANKEARKAVSQWISL